MLAFAPLLKSVIDDTLSQAVSNSDQTLLQFIE